ncbi:transcription factor bHLH148-like isoform X1 [Zingiber officinale]|uniref:transcription factor bHLH148-like isoform X1 n=1 Tax=Zingiber officinale TaxID=94328 RepID=UPI001C4C7EBC|nr:transcription factor bHLH148-like isoform X1 [Zingiber officinale]
MAVSDAVGEAAVGGGGERKRKRGSKPVPAKWRTEGEQRIYSSKLIDALRRVRRSSASAPSSPSSPPSDHVRNREVREAADRVLAVSARGRTRWSRAILSRRTLRRRVRLRACRPKPGSAACVSRAAAERRKSPAVEKKTRVLGRLVPGCRKLPLPSLLEEVWDYIPALEMQVRAMNAIAEAFSTAGGAPSSPTHVDSIRWIEEETM